MMNLILCLTLLNIGVTSNNAKEYNHKLDQIQEIMNGDMSGDIIQDYIYMPCRVHEGDLKTTACMDANLNTIMNHYKLRRELNLINKVK